MQRETENQATSVEEVNISIHSLYAEGDKQLDPKAKEPNFISIHSLYAEGDCEGLCLHPSITTYCASFPFFFQAMFRTSRKLHKRFRFLCEGPKVFMGTSGSQLFLPFQTIEHLSVCVMWKQWRVVNEHQQLIQFQIER